MKENKTNNTIEKSSSVATTKVERGTYLQELLDFYGGDYGTQKDIMETFMREHGYEGVAKFLEYGASQASN